MNNDSGFLLSKDWDPILATIKMDIVEKVSSMMEIEWRPIRSTAEASGGKQMFLQWSLVHMRKEITFSSLKAQCLWVSPQTAILLYYFYLYKLHKFFKSPYWILNLCFILSDSVLICNNKFFPTFWNCMIYLYNICEIIGYWLLYYPFCLLFLKQGWIHIIWKTSVLKNLPIW